MSLLDILNDDNLTRAQKVEARVRTTDGRAAALVSEDEARRVAQRIGAVEYHEVSAKTAHGLQRLFHRAINIAAKPDQYRTQPESELNCLVM